MKPLFLTLYLCLSTAALYAHEFWLEPETFRLQPGERTVLMMRVGENFKGEVWKFGQSRVLSFLQCHRSATKPLAPIITDGAAAPVPLLLEQQGTYLIGLHTSPKFIELDAEKFTHYLKEEGLTDILELRHARGEAKKAARELYRRCAKTLIQVGNTADETGSTVLGFPLEIIPEQNPYALNAGETLRAKILFQAAPLAQAQVKIWHKHNGKVKTQLLYTDEQGLVEFSIVPQGSWMISLVKMIEAADKAQADYESFWASLTFGFDH